MSADGKSALNSYFIILLQNFFHVSFSSKISFFILLLPCADFPSADIFVVQTGAYLMLALEKCK
jgi:hypothetical protein